MLPQGTGFLFRGICKTMGATGLLLVSLLCFSQVPTNINSGNPNFPFPQFKAYTGAPNTLANNNPQGVPHAELEQRIRDAYVILTNNMSYNINQNGTYSPLTVNGVKYIQPNNNNGTHCTCEEGDGYYLLAAAYMADKATFDGYFMWMHDRQFQKTVRYSDNVMNSPGYAYSPGISGAGSAGAPTNVYGGALGGNSPTDGDVDVALALLVAWKQWGDAGQICVDPQLGTVTYKAEAIKYIKTLADTLIGLNSLPIKKYISGDIGFDGYLRGGDSQDEVSAWNNSSPYYMGLAPEKSGGSAAYADYYAPAYFHTFADMLTAESESPWCIKQYRRAETSGDWLIGQSYAQGFLAQAGKYSITGTTAAFTAANQTSEDFRFSWRTILNYAWNGAPTRTWDPAAHQDIAGTNTYEYNAALRLATFMTGPEKAPYNNACMLYNTLTYGGPSNVRWDYTMSGTAGNGFPINWRHGAASPAAVVSGNADLQAKMFRHCIISWDQVNSGSQLYLTSQPVYFHEWFRLLGLLVLSGNLHDPMDFAAGSTQSNMKIYKAVDKTFAYVGDTITYTISYRNYSKQSATGVVITDNLPAGLQFISSSIPGTPSGSTVTWNIGAVTGFLTGGLAATMGSFTMKVKVLPAATGRLCNVATITATNGTGWTSNEYPNNITDVMERNCVDILPARPLSLTKTADKAAVAPGDVVTYTIVVKNNSVPFLNGGRPGVIVAGATNGAPASNNSLYLKYRIYHGAHEALINYQNYRVSYYLNKPGPPAWVLSNTINEGVATTPTQSQQTLIPGATWNHRFILQFPNQQATITPYLYYYNNNADKVHQGALVPQRLVSYIHDASWTTYDFSTDWSAEPANNASDGDPYWPIANDWTDPLVPNQPVLKYYPDACSNNVTTTIKKQLVEEWDGYTWRRIYGNAPVTGRELQNIVLKDVLPPELTFGGYLAGTPAGTLSGNTITWPTIPLLRINESVTYQFWGTVKATTCTPAVPPTSLVNTVNATATNESMTTATATSSITCPTPTPVTLIYFKGAMQPEGALLTWATANERNNHYFLLLKSYDAIHYDSLTTLPGNGTTSSISTYSYTDGAVNAGMVYYKLIQVDYDGTRTPGSVIALQNDAFSKLVVYPNPFTSEVHVSVMSPSSTLISIKVISITGNTVYSSDNHLTNEDIVFGTDLASGVYFVQVTNGQDVQMVKLVKNR